MKTAAQIEVLLTEKPRSVDGNSASTNSPKAAPATAAGASAAAPELIIPTKLVLALIVTAGTFGWTCWHVADAMPAHPLTFSLAISIGWMLLCAVTWGEVARAVIDYHRKTLEAAKSRELNARLIQEGELMRMVLDHLPDCIYAKDRQGRFVFNNLSHARHMGLDSHGNVKDKRDSDFFPDELASVFIAEEQKIIDSGLPIINREQFTGIAHDPASEKRWAVVSKVPWRDQQGNIVGTVGITHDIHELKLTQEALHQSEEKLREVMRRTHCILNFGEVEGPEGWRGRALDPVSPFLWNFPVQNVEAALEVLPLNVPPGSQYQQVWTAHRHPEDLVRMNRTAGEAFLRDAPYYQNQFRCTDKHGIEHWMHQHVTVHKLGQNRWQLFGITTDITDLKKTENALRQSKE